jgi:hypothetical protein
MFKNNKSGFINTVQLFLIILITTISLIVWSVSIVKSQTVFIDERNINTQLVIKKSLDGRCFSEEYGLIIESEFNRENIDNCFDEFSDSLIFRIDVSSNTFTYPNDDSEFSRLANLCLDTSSFSCTQMKYPIRYRVDSKDSMEILTLQVISTLK